MKYAISILTAIAVSASIACAQEAERSGKDSAGAERGDVRQRMQDRMKSKREGGGEMRGGKPGMEAGRERGEMRGEMRGGKPGMDGDGDRGEMFEHMLRNPEIREKLGLSEEDVEDIQKELYALKMKLIDLKAKMEKVGLEQAKAMTQKDVDEDKLMDLVEDAGKLRTEMAKLQIKKMVLFRKHIDPEKMEKIRGAMRERMQSRRQGEERPEGGMRERSGGEAGQRMEEPRRTQKGAGQE